MYIIWENINWSNIYLKIPILYVLVLIDLNSQTKHQFDPPPLNDCSPRSAAVNFQPRHTCTHKGRPIWFLGGGPVFYLKCVNRITSLCKNSVQVLVVREPRALSCVVAALEWHVPEPRHSGRQSGSGSCKEQTCSQYVSKKYVIDNVFGFICV